MIAVFLKNKLISADTIIPLMMSVKEHQPNRTIEFYSFDEETHQELRQNTVLWDALSSIGTLQSFDSGKVCKLQRYVNKLKILYFLLRLAVISCARVTHFVHFEALNSGPLCFLAIINSKRTILVESNCWGFNKIQEVNLANIKGQRRVPTKRGRASALLGFSKEWPELHHPDHAETPKVVVSSSHYAPAWRKFIHDNAKGYVGSILAASGWQEDKPCIVFILGYWGELPCFEQNTTSLRLFRETLAVIEKELPDVPVILKPHFITDRKTLSEVLAPLSDKQFIVANLHPMVLATQSIAFIGNYYSTTFADAVAMGVPVIEYTDYSDVTLVITQGKSMRPEYVTHFVNSDESGLRRVLRDLQGRQLSISKRIDEKDFTPALALFE